MKERGTICRVLFGVLLCCLMGSAYAQGQINVIEEFEEDANANVVVDMAYFQGELYVLNNKYGLEKPSVLYKMDLDGNNRVVLHEFTDEDGSPRQMILRDGILHGVLNPSSINFSAQYFRYTIATQELEWVRNFVSAEGKELELQIITDSLIWGTFASSTEDNGSVFRMDWMGNEFQKVYNDTTYSLGQNPESVIRVGDRLYISFLNGGITTHDGTNLVDKGVVASVDLEGNDYQVLFNATDSAYTRPYDLHYHQGYVYVLFRNAEPFNKGQIFRSKIDGSDKQRVGSLSNYALRGIQTYGQSLFCVSLTGLLKVNLETGLGNQLFWFSQDSISGREPTGLVAIDERSVAVATREEGAFGKGNIFRYVENLPPYVRLALQDLVLEEGFSDTTVSLSATFQDPNEDSLTISLANSDETVARLTLQDSVVLVEEGTLGTTLVELMATDRFGASVTTTFSITINEKAEESNDEDDGGDQITSLEEGQLNFAVFPNPARHTLTIEVTDTHLYRQWSIFDVRGNRMLRGDISAKETMVDISFLYSGMYFILIEGPQVHRQMLQVQ
ncbi:MAG TPA: hypothetical protein DCE41_27730 [Cytophagales bacterium]|nr:hypothetical protein [Cytophagales bacterium]HAA21352.1 hypothetical protein [Cytophagales bacterium]HAP58091.1 hypothetical protein [Cytophagales bacterium]